MNLDWLNKEQLQVLLKDLSLYRDLIKQVWKRWKKVYANLKEWENEFVVEFFPNLDKNFVLDEAKKIYEKTFSTKVSDKEIILKENEKIWWWMKVFFNDSLIDMSFSKFEKLIKN
jgi:alpha-amylase/alpha-mannosidase (GH57 family)